MAGRKIQVLVHLVVLAVAAVAEAMLVQAVQELLVKEMLVE